MFKIFASYLGWITESPSQIPVQRKEEVIERKEAIETEFEILNDEKVCMSCQSSNIWYQPLRLHRADDKRTRVKTCLSCKQVCIAHKPEDRNVELLIVIEKEDLEELQSTLEEQAKQDALVAAGDEETAWLFDVDFYFPSASRYDPTQYEEIMVGGVYGVNIEIGKNFVEWGPVNLNSGCDMQRITSVLVTKDEFKCYDEVVCPVLRFKINGDDKYRWYSDLPFNPQDGVTKIDMSILLPTIHHYNFL